MEFTLLDMIVLLTNMVILTLYLGVILSTNMFLFLIDQMTSTWVQRVLSYLFVILNQA